MGVYLNDVELEALGNWEPALCKAYVWLRSRMDRATRIVGRVTTISLAALAERMDYQIRKGQGWQWIRIGETPQQRKDAAARLLERLEKAGALRKLGGAFLCFLCPLADEAPVRANQTGHERATGLYTELATVFGVQGAVNKGVFDMVKGEQDTPENVADGANGPHIKGQEVYLSQSSSTTGRGVEPGDDAAARGVNRDRAAPSQAGSACGRPGADAGYRDRPAGSHVGPQGADCGEGYRGRPAASHPAQMRRLAAGPDAGGTLFDGQEPTSARSSAEKESFGAAGRASAETPEGRNLRAVLLARGIKLDAREPQVEQWAAEGVSPDDVAAAVEKARSARIKADSEQPIPLNYIVKVMASMRAAEQRAIERLEGRARGTYRGGVADLAALARRLGIDGARPGETEAMFRDRVRAAHQAAQGGERGQA